ncbi:MAG: SDR family NAD(P)-dependent oxidoreductase, partial [Microbacterium sp.]|nr:SDR family NAD(P)-dependent oxidoreductase [Microbacterium sp.]
MSTLLVVGYGPGISRFVAERWAREGYSIALVARSHERAADAADKLRAAGVPAAAYEA